MNTPSKPQDRTGFGQRYSEEVFLYRSCHVSEIDEEHTDKV